MANARWHTTFNFRQLWEGERDGCGAPGEVGGCQLSFRLLGTCRGGGSWRALLYVFSRYTASERCLDLSALRFYTTLPLPFRCRTLFLFCFLSVFVCLSCSINMVTMMICYPADQCIWTRSLVSMFVHVGRFSSHVQINMIVVTQLSNTFVPVQWCRCLWGRLWRGSLCLRNMLRFPAVFLPL